jgi:hypothetical protein
MGGDGAVLACCVVVEEHNTYCGVVFLVLASLGKNSERETVLELGNSAGG